MITEEQILKAYEDYRESIGRPRVNTNENWDISITYAHFKAGYLAAMSSGEDLL